MLARIGRILVAAALLGGAAACAAITGLDGFELGANGGGGSGGGIGGSSGSGGGGGGGGGSGSGSGGSGGAVHVCDPGTTMPCYTGPSNTEGVGTCAVGISTCAGDGTGYGPCEGEVLPATEVCGNSLDEDCDGLEQEPSCLTSRGLVVRYFIDEAAGGQAPVALEDSAPGPLSLPLTYTPELSFVEEGGHRGLSWASEGVAGRASIQVDGTKIMSALNGSQVVTIEVVVRIVAVDNDASRIVHIGVNQESGRLGLRSAVLGEIEAWWNNEMLALWSLPLSGRKVLHAVIDSTQSVPADRIRLFVDGSPAPAPPSSQPPLLGEALDLNVGRYLVLGNREDGIRSFEGVMYYAALYSAALTESEIGQNAMVLLATDDDLGP